jgi:predicted ArsR family transcriptional regulator
MVFGLAASLSKMDRSILELLGERIWLRYDEIATVLGERPDAIRSTLVDLRERGLVQALSIGEIEAHRRDGSAYWRLTEKGRGELSRRPPG